MFIEKDTSAQMIDNDQSMSVLDADQQSQFNNLIKIPKIEDSDTDKMQPNDIYLESCKVFAWQNLKYDVLNIEPITFTQNHIKEGVLAENLSEDEIKKYNFLARVSDAGSRYINVGIWNFMEILFISYSSSDEKDLNLKKQQTNLNGTSQTEHKQNMVIKTWEQHQCQVPPMLSEFYVKTIRIYDLQNKLLDTILVEKIEGNFSGDNIYDTSIISFNSKIYYFKRVWTSLEETFVNGTANSALLQDSMQQQSEDSSPKKSAKGLNKNYQTDQTQRQDQQWQTRLELYSYDLQSSKEESCTNSEGKPYIIYEPSFDGHVHQDGSITHNINVTFSKEFGRAAANEDLYNNEIEFLEKQYVCTQAYIEKSDNKEFQLYCLKDLTKELHNCETRVQNDPNYVDHTILMTRQIQSLNHFISDDENGQQTIVFILINTNSHIHFHYNPKTGNVTTVKFDGQNTFHKSLNSYIEVQKLNISYNDEDDVLTHVEQYFFVDNNNQIQLLYPNFDQKSQKFLITDIVSSDAKIGQQDSRYFKKINRVHAKNNGPTGDQIQNEACAKDNTTQDIEHLRKILNFKTITKDQVFTFCSDNQDQILYITQAIEPKVIVIQVKDNHSEECWDTLVEESGNKIRQLMGQKLGNQMIEKDHGKGAHKQLRKQQRMKSLTNALNQRIPQRIAMMCSEEQNNDIITIDINTQEVIVTRNENAKKQGKIDANSKEASDIDMRQITASRISQDNMIVPDGLNQTGKNFTLIEADYGVDHKIKIQNLDDNDVDPNEQINVEITQKNEYNYIFILSAVSFIEEIKKVSYFIVKKSIEEVEILVNSGLEVTQEIDPMYVEGKYLLSANDDIKLIVGPDIEDGLQTIKFKDIGKFKLQHKGPNQNLTFEKYVDPNVYINFLAVVYQESFHNKNNYMLIIDIDTCEIRKKIPVNPNAINQQYMYVDAQGFNSFKICRTSDVDYRTREIPGTWCKKPKTFQIHETIYKIFTIYVEKLGRIQAQEFLITHDEEQIDIQAIGQNQMMMSKECIQNSDWNQIKNSVVLPFHFYDFSNNREGQVKNIGCQFFLNREKGKPLQINMIDRMFNNLYIYMSQILLIGQKRFQINKNDQSDYLIIISARITDEIIEKKIFQQYETYSLLKGAQEIMIEMRRPDLEYILLNTFQNLKENDFFVSQEMLLGKSICDISLSDPRSVREALANYKQDKSNINCSIVFELIKGDELRKEAFQEIKFYPKNQVIKYDFNFDTTINMGLRMQSIKSVTLLLNFIIDEINTLEYYDLIMLDLHEIFEAKIINLNSFFSESANEQINTVGATQITGCQEERKALGYCNVEIPIESEELVIFSDKEAQFETISSFENIHEIEDELVDYINKRQEEDDKEKEKNGEGGDMENSKEIEHSYIDLKFLIIGDKIKHMYEEEEFDNLKYDDEYLSGLIMSTDNNNEFYMQESVQKIIDYQFQQTQKGMTYLFWFYIVCYIIPYSVTLVSENVTVHLYVLRICVIPQVVLLIIELIQMKENGLDYIQGWNLIDLMQIIVFFFMFSTVQQNAMREGMTDENGNMIPEQEAIHSPFLPFIKIQLVALSFAKTLHFITVYEDLGFFVIMVQRSFIDLIPFIMSYLFFQCFWATVFAVLKVEIDAEVASAVGLGYFGSLFLMVWRNSTGKLGLQNYTGLNNMPKSALLYVNIELIWLAYFAQIIFMLVIMLNFIIAIIDQTYVAVNKNKNIFVYMNKAELNEEYYQLAKYFKPLKQFRVIIFSTSKELYDEINESKEEEEQRSLIETFRRFIGKENENNFQLQSANNVINELIQKQQDFEFQMETEFSRYSKYLKDFKKKAYKKQTGSIDESMVSDSRSEFTGKSQSTPQNNTRGGAQRKSSFASGQTPKGTIGGKSKSQVPQLSAEEQQQYITFRNNRQSELKNQQQD